jgi:hypothetical protein
LDKAVLEKGKNGKTEFWHWFDYIVGVVTAEKELWRSDNTVPERRKNGTPKKNTTDVCPAHWIFGKKNYDYE